MLKTIYNLNPENSSNSKEIKKQLTALFIAGVSNKDAAKKANISIGKVSYFRRKLVVAGIIEPLRRRKTRKNNLFKTPIIKQKLNITSIQDDIVFFRINQMDVKISEAKNVHVGKGMIEIKY